MTPWIVIAFMFAQSFINFAHGRRLDKLERGE